MTRAGWPRRTAFSPAAMSRSKMLSTPMLLGAQARTFSPRRTAWRMSSTTAVVLPVPGGPWMRARVACGEGELDGLLLGRIEPGVEGGQVVAGKELRLSLGEEHVAEVRQPLAAGGACSLQGGLLPGGCDFVVGEIEPPLVVIVEVLGGSPEGDP